MQFVAIDTETTGLSAAKGDRMVEIGLVKCDTEVDGYIIDEYSSLLHIPSEIPDAAIRVHLIFNKDLIGQPKFPEVFPKVRDFIGDLPMVAHNADFDGKFMKNELDLAGLSMKGSTMYCTLKMAKQMYPNLIRYDLELLYIFTGSRDKFGFERAHRALGDARMCGRVMAAFTKDPKFRFNQMPIKF